MSKNFKKSAFTLAEVLITLAIIGVVAAMTLPTLIQKHQKQEWVTELRASMSILSNGLKKMMADEEVTSLFDTDFATRSCLTSSYETEGYSFDRCLTIMQKYFKGVTVAANIPVFAQTDRTYVLQNGMYVYFWFYPFVIVDVNGERKPNKFGRDIFVLGINPNGNIEPRMVPPYRTTLTENEAFLDDVTRMYMNDATYLDDNDAIIVPAENYEGIYNEHKLALADQYIGLPAWNNLTAEERKECLKKGNNTNLDQSSCVLSAAWYLSQNGWVMDY